MFITRLILFIKEEISPLLIIIDPLRPFLLCAKYLKNWSINIVCHLLRISNYLVVHNLVFKAIKNTADDSLEFMDNAYDAFNDNNSVIALF